MPIMLTVVLVLRTTPQTSITEKQASCMELRIGPTSKHNKTNSPIKGFSNTKNNPGPTATSQT